MSAALVYRSNAATPADIAAHLRQCDAQFVPPLSGRANIEDYARKIDAQAVTFEAWCEGTLVGLVAAYCNDQGAHIAYVTNVSVMPAWTGQGIARRLLNECFTHAAAAGMRQVRLEVSEANAAAIRLYEKLGFIAGKANRAWLGMTLDLKKRGSK